MKLENEVAIITGGTKGVGYRIAEGCLKEGAKITVCSRNVREGVKAAKELGKLGEVLYLQTDVSSIEDNQMLVDETVKKYGRLDILVANAGIDSPDKTHYLHIAEEQYDRILDVNLERLSFGDQLAARQMVKQGQGGAIVDISPVNAYLASDSQMCCTTSKGGVSQLTKVRTVTLTPYDIKVNAICPGPIESELMRRVGSDEQLFNTVISRTPIDRIGTPNGCGRLAMFLACDDSNFVYGQSIYIDGDRSFQAFPVPGYETVTGKQYEKLTELEQKQKGNKK